jgi:hypothetical protein
MSKVLIMRTLLLSLVFLIVVRLPVTPAQNSSSQAPPISNPEQLADEWFTRLNALDDWYISVDGREENSAVVDRFMELYGPDAYHQVGPSENQIGPVVFHGTAAIRKWADDFSKKYVNVNYRVEYKTSREKTLQPFYSIQMPWGGTGTSTEFAAVYTNRIDRRQFVVPGAVFFLFDEAGKIQNVRLYLLKDELVEIGA